MGNSPPYGRGAALWGEFNAFIAEYGEAAEALLSGKLEAASWFPEGSSLPAMIFVGDPAPPTPPPPPTRQVTETESGTVERGEIPVVEIPGRWQAEAPQKPEAGGASAKRRTQYMAGLAAGQVPSPGLASAVNVSNGSVLAGTRSSSP